MHSASSRSGSTLTSGFTTTTSALSSTARARYELLPADTVIRIAVRADRFSTLHAMAATCKCWENNLAALFSALRRVGVAEHEDFERLCQSFRWQPPTGNVPRFAWSYLVSRLQNHHHDEGIEDVRELTHGVVNAIGRMSPDLRARSAKAWFPILKHLSSEDWSRLLTFVKSGSADERHADLFRLAVYSHPNAYSIVRSHDPHCAIEDVLSTFTVQASLSDVFRQLLAASGGDEHLLDGLFRTWLFLGDATLLMSLQVVFDPTSDERVESISVAPATLLRWLEIDASIAVRAALLGYLLPTLPTGSEGRLMDLIAACVDPDERDGLLNTLCTNEQHFVRVCSGDRTRLRHLVQTVTAKNMPPIKRAQHYLFVRSKPDAMSEAVQRFVQRLQSSGVVSATLINAWREKS